MEEKKDTRFKKGNQWWRMRTKHGPDALFKEPALLFDECCAYFEATDKRKWNKVDYKGKDIEKVLIPTDTPYTLSGLCLYLGINQGTWSKWRNDRLDLNEVITQVDAIIYTQKFEGATVGIYNSNIIARDLGLIDKTDNKNLNVELSKDDITPDEIKKIKDALNDAY